MLDFESIQWCGEVADAVRRLVVRGAPAIGVCAAFGLVLGLREGTALHAVAEQVSIRAAVRKAEREHLR